MNKVRLAIVGCGTISQLNAPGYLEHEQCEVGALCDPARERAEQRAAQWGITPRIYTSYDQLLDDPDIDTVELLTPTPLHAEQSIAALEAGKHVSCQKPMARNLEEAARVAEAAARADTFFRVTENFLYYPPLVKAKELIDSGVIGEPNMVRMRVVVTSVEAESVRLPLAPDALTWRRDPVLNPGGLLYDEGSHKYATAMWWVGEPATVKRHGHSHRRLHGRCTQRRRLEVQKRQLLGRVRVLQRTRHADPRALLRPRRLLRSPGRQRNHLGHPLQRRNARPAARDAAQGHRDRQLPGPHGLDRRIQGRRARLHRWNPRGTAAAHGRRRLNQGA